MYSYTNFCGSHSFEKLVKKPLFSLSVLCDFLRPQGLQHARLPCPSPGSPGVYPNSCPLSQRYHPTISSSVDPFSSRLQSFLASGSFPVSQFFASCGQSAGASASASINIQDFQWIFRTGFLWDWLAGSPCSPGVSQESSPTPQFKSISSLALSFLYGPTLTSMHDCWKKPQNCFLHKCRCACACNFVSNSRRFKDLWKFSRDPMLSTFVLGQLSGPMWNC